MGELSRQSHPDVPPGPFGEDEYGHGYLPPIAGEDDEATIARYRERASAEFGIDYTGPITVMGTSVFREDPDDEEKWLPAEPGDPGAFAVVLLDVWEADGV